jgi:hypothetical protein
MQFDCWEAILPSHHAGLDDLHNTTKAKFIGLAKVKAQTVFTLAVYNLTRMATIFGWRLNTI